ncbi:hypothetical protein ACPUER_03640 [Burkholderia sp. DN3021]|uniref:hypothetical protein n=1 Tax=Burkholderia sp. DN3021 TaxID=3410137 RepID=UPI00285E06AD|nr:hypothetical protein [Burkholderia ambifaria]MDR6496988.1 hypothetical protein [Burkholderia ambifaria]
MKEFGIIRRWRGCLLGACLMVLMSNAFAFGWELRYANVTDSYGGCLWRNNGDGTSTIQVVFNYRSIAGASGNYPFRSRGVLIYTYDAKGNLQPSSAAAKYVTMNGIQSAYPYTGNGYVMYAKSLNPPPEWGTKEPYTALVEVLIDNAAIKDWPGISIRAGNYTSGDDVGEITGGVYVTNASIANACQVIDPEVPPPKPPPSLVVDVAAPDWNLGELPRGNGEKTLTGAAQQLCFTYTGLDGYRNFVINATSTNGISGNRYLLRNTSKPSQTIPYDMTLDSGSATFRLPNTSASAVRLNNNYRTCFVPTFRTSVDMTVDAGDYNDVLSFTVVTKS